METTDPMTTCSDCGLAYPTLHILLDGDGAHARCLSCFLQLALAVERVGNRIVFSVERAEVRTE